MQAYIEIKFVLLVLTIFFLIICVFLLFYCTYSIFVFRKKNSSLKKSNRYRLQILEEHTRIRHDNNNILQTITNLIEEKDLEGLIEYKSIMINKVHNNSSNSFTQLGKIKSDNVLNIVYQLYSFAATNNFNIKLYVCSEIISDFPYGKEIYPILEKCFSYAVNKDKPTDSNVELRIKENENGILFSFNSEQVPKTNMYITKAPQFASKKLRKRIVYNAFIKNHEFIQELMINY